MFEIFTEILWPNNSNSSGTENLTFRTFHSADDVILTISHYQASPVDPVENQQSFAKLRLTSDPTFPCSRDDERAALQQSSTVLQLK